MTLDKWDHRFIRVAEQEVASWSKDPQAKVGCIIVSPDKRQVTWGYNGFPQDIEDTESRLNCQKTKLELTIHAELNALLNAGVDVTGWTLYVSKAPCFECAKAIVRENITRVVCHMPSLLSTWYPSQRKAQALFKDEGVICDYIGDPNEREPRELSVDLAE